MSDWERKLLTFMYLMNIWFKRRQERGIKKEKKKSEISTGANRKQVFFCRRTTFYIKNNASEKSQNGRGKKADKEQGTDKEADQEEDEKEAGNKGTTHRQKLWNKEHLNYSKNPHVTPDITTCRRIIRKAAWLHPTDKRKFTQILLKRVKKPGDMQSKIVKRWSAYSETWTELSHSQHTTPTSCWQLLHKRSSMQWCESSIRQTKIKQPLQTGQEGFRKRQTITDYLMMHIDEVTSRQSSSRGQKLLQHPQRIYS